MDTSEPNTEESILDRTGYEYTLAPDEPYSVGVVQAVAEVADCSPLDLPEALYNSIDADALDALLATGDGTSADVQCSFTFCGYDVTVSPDGTVVVQE